MTDDARTIRVAVLGCGVMGEAVLAGVLRGGWLPADVTFTERSPERAAEIETRHQVAAAADNPTAVADAGVVILAVKPQDLAAVLAEIRDSLAPSAVVMSVAAGLPTTFYEARLPAGTPVVRVMPNTPLVVGHGVSAISAGAAAGEVHLALVERLLAATGVVVRVPEKNQDAVSAISGSGPAYVYYMVDALAEAGVLLGLTRDLSRRLAIGTVLGSAHLMEVTGEHPVVLREQVSSPGGTTVAALRELDDRGVRAAFIAAAEAARNRSRQLSAELGG